MEGGSMNANRKRCKEAAMESPSAVALLASYICLYNPLNVDWNLKHELIKGLISGASGVVLLALTWLIGQRLSYQWSVRQKRRELQLASLQQFYGAYGEFFAIWKLWNRLDDQDAMRAERRWELLKRSAAAEATIEGTLVKLSVEL